MKLKELFDEINLVFEFGFFHTLNDQFEPEFLEDYDTGNLDFGYFYNHSGEKLVSPLIENLMKQYDISTGLAEELMPSIVNVVYNMYKDKWAQMYKALQTDSYIMLDDYREDRIETPNLTETETPDITVTNLDKTKSKITETNTELINDSTFGFNSSASVNKDQTGTDSTNVVEGNLEDNVSDRTQVKTGSNTVHKTGNNRVEISGLRDHTPQEMIQQELELRKQNFVELLYKDLDKVLTLSIY